MDAHPRDCQIRSLPRWEIPRGMASKEQYGNERTTLVIEGEHGEVLFRQIAGAVARRIRYYITPGLKIEWGDEVGFIKFGSRIDLFLPLDAVINVQLDQKVTGKETLIVTMK